MSMTSAVSHSTDRLVVCRPVEHPVQSCDLDDVPVPDRSVEDRGAEHVAHGGDVAGVPAADGPGRTASREHPVHRHDPRRVPAADRLVEHAGPWNVRAMLVTLLVSQPPIGWLNARPGEHVGHVGQTLEVSQAPIGRLNTESNEHPAHVGDVRRCPSSPRGPSKVVPANISLMSVDVRGVPPVELAVELGGAVEHPAHVGRPSERGLHRPVTGTSRPRRRRRRWWCRWDPTRRPTRRSRRPRGVGRAAEAVERAGHGDLVGVGETVEGAGSGPVVPAGLNPLTTRGVAVAPVDHDVDGPQQAQLRSPAGSRS